MKEKNKITIIAVIITLMCLCAGLLIRLLIPGTCVPTKIINGTVVSDIISNEDNVVSDEDKYEHYFIEYIDNSRYKSPVLYGIRENYKEVMINLKEIDDKKYVFTDGIYTVTYYFK